MLIWDARMVRHEKKLSNVCGVGISFQGEKEKLGEVESIGLKVAES